MTNNDAAKILTTTTRRFRGNVLAKQDKSGTRPVTYANLSQAERKRDELRGADLRVPRHRELAVHGRDRLRFPMSVINCHCTERSCGKTVEVAFCGQPETACACSGTLFCLHCGEPLDYETLHAEADYYASLRAGV